MTKRQTDYGFGGIDPARFGMQRDSEKRGLRRHSMRIGLCLIAFTIVQQILVLPLVISPVLRELYNTVPAFADIAETVIYLCSMLLPFLLSYRLMRPDEKEACNVFGRPVSKAAAAAAVAACFFFCTVGDYATNVLLDFMEKLGFTANGGTYDPATNLWELFSGILQIAVLPALAEEFAMRSIVLQPMRRFGDRYAILMSAFVFALMHGNMVQIPFAFIAGIAFGYYVVATGSIWVGVLAHFLNNAYSVVLNYLVETKPPVADTVYQIVLSITIVLGIGCVVLFWKLIPHNKVQTPPAALSGGEKTAVFLFTIPMVIAMIGFVVVTVQLTDFTGF